MSNPMVILRTLARLSRRRSGGAFYICLEVGLQHGTERLLDFVAVWKTVAKIAVVGRLELDYCWETIRTTTAHEHCACGVKMIHCFGHSSVSIGCETLTAAKCCEKPNLSCSGYWRVR